MAGLTVGRGREVVVVDDEPNMTRVLGKMLTMEGYSPTLFQDPRAALAHVLEHRVFVLVSDLRMPGLTGEELLERLRAAGCRTEVILMTAYGTVESALRCVRAGAFDYITKPFDTARLMDMIGRAADKASGAMEGDATPREETTAATEPSGSADWELVGDSQPMQQVRDLITRCAATSSAVLVQGESGTGKELAARAIHARSPRRGARFLAVNCASIPETLIESELFGHERGAFTGAVETRIGLFEAADGGTLFLDEVGELPPPMQAKLLRVLQEREITRVGRVDPIRVDVRIVAATNRRLEDMVAEGRFREDLFYRLNVLVVRMPPLRRRSEDIPLLASRFAEEFARRENRPTIHLTPELLGHLQRQKWPGNVRELRNLVERLVVLNDGTTLGVEALDALRQFDSGVRPPAAPPAANAGPHSDAIQDFREARNQFEANYLRSLLRACRGNVTEAAKRAGMSRRNLYEKIEKLGIGTDEFKEST
jgi:DNA-binding NtrC family response regulator